MKSSLEKRYARLQNLETKFRTRLSQAQGHRLIVAGLFFLVIVVYALNPDLKFLLYTLPVFIAVFSYLVGKCNRLKKFSLRLNALALFYERQSLRQRGLAVSRNWQEAFDSVKDTADITTIQDLNLIGPHSLFTSLDETVSDGGRKILATWMSHPDLNRENIFARQESTRGLSQLRWFFIRLLITASESEAKLSTKSVQQILAEPFLTARTKKVAMISIIAWFICLGLVIASKVTGFGATNWIVILYMVIGHSCLNRIGPLFMRGQGLSLQLTALANIFTRIESRIEVPALKKLMPTVAQARPSHSVAQFNRILNFVSVESNALFYLILNSLFPYAPVFGILLEKSRERIAAQFPECLAEFNELEAQASLVFMHIYQTNTFPVISPTDKPVFHARGLFHPLIDRSKVVANDFAFKSEHVLGLLTGSNMSGKSTFLRTLGVNQTLANMGAPVFAQSLTTSPLNVRSCIQVSDSLRDGFSYFYSEVIRLKSLMDDVKSGKQTLFLVDEIFRGTNNRERQIGSRAVIQSLCEGTHSLGFVSTHDLELTTLSETLPSLINLHFQESYDGDKMFFSYRLQHGPCTTTNALKIMQDAGFDLSSAHS